MIEQKNLEKINEIIIKSKTLKRLGSLKRHHHFNLIVDSTSFLPKDSSVSMRLWHIANSYYKIPKCKMCNNNAPWSKKDKGYYRVYCSSKCAHTDIVVLNKTKKTNLERYGSITPMQNPKIREDIIKKWGENLGVKNPSQSEVIKEKKKQTLIKNWGVEYPLQNKEIKEKCENTCLEKYGEKNIFASTYGKQKIAGTILKKYNVEYCGQSKEVQEKRKETNLKKHGAEHVWCSGTDTRQKQQKTMLEKYGTTSISSLSDEILEKLNDKQWLIEQHHTLKKTLEKIADEISVSGSTICNYLKKYDIEIKTRSSSMAEREIIEFMKSLTSSTIISNSRKIIPPYELDIYIPKYNIAIEYNGLFWHSEQGGKDKNYHITKTEMCEAVGIRLIHIFEDEWRDQKQKCKDTLRHLLGRSPKGVYARKTTIKEISWKTSKDFLNKYHLLNAGTPGNYRIGAFDGNVLVGVMVFGDSNNENSGKGNIELKRFVTNKKNNPGLGSKMFKYAIIQNGYTKVTAFVDRRWFTGLVKSYIGFKVVGVSPPALWWTNNENRYHRRFTTKKKLINQGYSEKMSKINILLSQGYTRIWDCGKIKLTWTK